ncbi:hypothetical protein C5167_009669 [Papaver somniferum]|uniref:Uncharacterized protein n=1 Tax=Papaver somniferum TaxID=3469 RepID=A0A4Y7JZI0_PAPSO|nr:hypothetical protein C5167_009669 [Papaver somniferum]
MQSRPPKRPLTCTKYHQRRHRRSQHPDYHHRNHFLNFIFRLSPPPPSSFSFGYCRIYFEVPRPSVPSEHRKMRKVEESV